MESNVGRDELPHVRITASFSLQGLLHFIWVISLEVLQNHLPHPHAPLLVRAREVGRVDRWMVEVTEFTRQAFGTSMGRSDKYTRITGPVGVRARPRISGEVQAWLFFPPLACVIWVDGGTCRTLFVQGLIVERHLEPRRSRCIRQVLCHAKDEKTQIALSRLEALELLDFVANES